MTPLYSYLDTRLPKTTLDLPAIEVRYSSHPNGPGYYVFERKHADQDEESLAGTWWGPVESRALAIVFANEQAQSRADMIKKWIAALRAQMGVTER
jgi:hypothetical protein